MTSGVSKRKLYRVVSRNRQSEFKVVLNDFKRRVEAQTGHFRESGISLWWADKETPIGAIEKVTKGKPRDRTYYFVIECDEADLVKAGYQLFSSDSHANLRCPRCDLSAPICQANQSGPCGLDHTQSAEELVKLVSLFRFTYGPVSKGVAP